MKRRTSRRDFLKQTSLAGTGFWVAGGLALAGSKSPNEKINIACIGVGGKGSSDSEQAALVGNVVALCDIDDNRLNTKANQKRNGELIFAKARKYHDFRRMLEERGKEIDAVVVSTPDHTHAIASITAMKMGKHVYCQKPLTHFIGEARLMRETAAKMKVATQMGNQGSAEDGLRRAVEAIQAGVIGPVREVHVWTNRPFGYWKQAPDITARPKETPPVPAHVHWDLFLGPAPERPYHPAYHPHNWRGWWDFGTGALGDMGCHTANMAFRALKLEYPTSVVAECGDVNPETYPAWATVTLEFPARGSMPPVKLVWHEGNRDGQRNLPSKDLLYGQTPPPSGSLLIGDKGTLYSPNDYGARFVLYPEKDFADYQPPKPTLPRKDPKVGIDPYMKQEWVAAIKGGPSAYSNFEIAGKLTETILLGNIATRFRGRKLAWDGPGLKFTNAAEANQYLLPEYRKGWHL